MASVNATLVRLIRGNFSYFCEKVLKTVDPAAKYLHNWHIDIICDYLDACRRGEINKLIINIPPRYMKSIIVSVAFPAWLMGHDPREKILCASYSASLSIKHSVDTRMVCSSSWYREAFPEFRIVGDQNEKQKFVTSSRGHRIATSVGGTATGEGGNYLIADDPHNPLEAQSDVKRQNALNWYGQTWSSRLNDKKKGTQIVVMQRLHENDVSGHLLESGGWEHLKIPMIAPTKTTVQFNGKVYKERNEGDVLHPERETIKELKEQKLLLGDYGWSGQMQQDPSPSDGGIIKRSWFEFYDEKELKDLMPNVVQKIGSCDTAFSEKKSADFSVGGTFYIWKRDGETRYYMTDLWRIQEGYPVMKQTLENSYAKHKHDLILIEDKASGQSLIQDLKRHTNIPIRAIKVDTDKVTRAYAASPQIESGKLFLPKFTEWLTPYIDELTAFPRGKNDDQVDMTTQFLNHAKGIGAFNFIIV